MRSNTLLTQRNLSIYDDFEVMFNDGKRLEVIYNNLSCKYFMMPETIAKIVLGEAKKKKSKKSTKAGQL